MLIYLNSTNQIHKMSVLSSKDRITQLKKRFYHEILPRLRDREPRLQGDTLFGPSPPNLLIGSFGYPRVYAGPMVSLDNPVSDYSRLYGRSYSEIVKTFVMSVRGKRPVQVRNNSRLIERMQEVALSYKTIDVEVDVKNRPTYTPEFNEDSIPYGYTTYLRDLRIVENPKVPRIVYSRLDDDLRASEFMYEMYEHGLDVYYISRLLTTGLLGRKPERKLVPTKWSITATDDILAKENMRVIREYPEIDRYYVYENEFLHNRFYILFLPGRWEYEQFEAWPEGSEWNNPSWGFNHEYEPYRGRTRYAELQAGGYYAARLPVTEHLRRLRRQARVIVFREIDQEYAIPVGVWQVRENVRHALMTGPTLTTDNLGEVFVYLDNRLKSGLSRYVRVSRILGQKRLFEG